MTGPVTGQGGSGEKKHCKFNLYPLHFEHRQEKLINMSQGSSLRFRNFLTVDNKHF